MQENGLNHFGSIEEFKHAFLPLHDECSHAVQSVKQGSKKTSEVENSIKKHIDVLKADVVKIDQYVEHYKGTLLPFSLAGTGSEVFKEVIDVQREAASIFTSNLKNIDQLSSISKSFQLDSSVSEELEKIRSKTHLKAKDLLQAFAHIRSYEDLCYQCMMLVEEEEERRRKQALLEEQRIEKAKKAAELRKKSLQKKLLWTGGFIIILVGFLKSQMV